MVFLGRVEFTCRGNLGYDRSLEGFVFFESGLRLQGDAMLFFTVEENGATVLIAHIAELAVLDCRVDVAPINVEQLAVAGFRRIKDDLYRFGVSCTAGGYLFIGGVLYLAARVAWSNRHHSRQLVEGGFHAPETAAGKGGFFGCCSRNLLKGDQNESNGNEET